MRKARIVDIFYTVSAADLESRNKFFFFPSSSAEEVFILRAFCIQRIQSKRRPRRLRRRRVRLITAYARRGAGRSVGREKDTMIPRAGGRRVHERNS